MIDNLSITVHAFTKRTLTSLSVDEILLPSCVNLSIYLRELALKVEMTPLLKYMNSVLFALTQRLMRPAA